MEHDQGDWWSVTLPHTDIPVGADRAYRAWFDLTAVPLSMYLNIQSDDGLWLYVNGQPVGHWGGDWQQEGCVNEHANCLETTSIEPVDITPWLVPGSNLLAARVSNPVENAYFEISPECRE